MTGRDKDPTVKFNQRKKIIKKKIKWNKTKLKKKLKKKKVIHESWSESDVNCVVLMGDMCHVLMWVRKRVRENKGRVQCNQPKCFMEWIWVSL